MTAGDEEKRDSGFGKISCVIALVAPNLSLLLPIFWSTVGNTNGPLDAALGLVDFSATFAPMAGVACGIVGLLQKNRGRVYPILGLAVNSLILLVEAFLIFSG